jgi:hypothetical protein
MTESTFGSDPSQWSNARMTSVGLTVAGGVAGAFTSLLVSLAGRRRRRLISARALRQYHQAGVRIVRLERAYLEARLSMAGVQHAELQRNLERDRADHAQTRRRRRLAGLR